MTKIKHISKCYCFLKSVLLCSVPQLNFPAIEMPRILLSITVNLAVAHISSDILLWQHSIWHSSLTFYSGILSRIYSDIRSGIYSDIFSGILSGILSMLQHSFWHQFWHPIRRSILAFSWRLFWHGRCRTSTTRAPHPMPTEISGSWLRSDNVHWDRGWGTAVPTEIWRSRLRSGSAHWDLELAVKVWRCPLRSGAHGWAPAVPTEIWYSQLRFGRTDVQKEGWGGGGSNSDKNLEITWQVGKNVVICVLWDVVGAGCIYLCFWN